MCHSTNIEITKKSYIHIIIIHVKYWKYKLIRSVFVIKNGFILKQNERTDQSKYCPSLITTFSYFSGNFRILSQTNVSSFEAIHLLKTDRTNYYSEYYTFEIFLGVSHDPFSWNHASRVKTNKFIVA